MWCKCPIVSYQDSVRVSSGHLKETEHRLENIVEIEDACIRVPDTDVVVGRGGRDWVTKRLAEERLHKERRKGIDGRNEGGREGT